MSVFDSYRKPEKGSVPQKEDGDDEIARGTMIFFLVLIVVTIIGKLT